MGEKDITGQVVSELQKGSREAFDLIYCAYSLHVYNFLHAILFDKTLAADLTQDVFFKIWEKREGLDPDLDFDSYIFTIARNLVFKESRKRRVREAYIAEVRKTEADSEETTSRYSDWKFSSEDIDAIIRRMPPARRNIYILNKKEQMSVKEIASRLGLSPKTVENQLYQANLFMRREFFHKDNEGNGPDKDI
jgi:RNA polymerase sigma-70 factor, Bacteroides expansion family 1